MYCSGGSLGAPDFFFFFFSSSQLLPSRQTTETIIGEKGERDTRKEARSPRRVWEEKETQQ
jgi:hypothetical protein